MNRRDTIIVAVLLNAAIIAVLLMMAVNTDEELLHDRPEILTSTKVMEKNVSSNLIDSQRNLAEDSPQRTSENRGLVDLESVGLENMLHDYSTSSPTDLFLVDGDLNLLLEKPFITSERPHEIEMSGVKIVEVAVKKGDSLDKIARVNGTTVEAIKRLSQLKNEKLSIGQVLKVPVGVKKQSANPSQAPIADNSPSEVVYYTIKSGDNPWKIAKQQKLDMDELLRLNNLNEEKARNLKIGDRIRIR